MSMKGDWRMLGSVFARLKRRKNSTHEAVIDFIRGNKDLYESQFGETAVSIIMQPKLMILMIFFLSMISFKYFGATKDWRFLVALVPVSVTAFLHPRMTRLFSNRNRYLILYLHIFFYIAFNLWNQIALQVYYPSVVPNEQFVMIVILTLILASFIATSPYYGRTLLLNSALLGIYMIGMQYSAHLRNIDILRHAVQGLGLGGALSFVMMTIYRYRVYFIFQENVLKERAEKIQAIHADIVTMQNTMPASILKIDKSQIIIYANKTMEYLGLSEMTGMSMREFISNIDESDSVSLDTKEQFYQALLSFLGENYAICYEPNTDKLPSEFLFKQRPVSVKYGPHIDAQGNVDYLLLTISDNRAKVQIEEQKLDNDIVLCLVENLPKAAGFIADAYHFVSKVELILRSDFQAEAWVELKRTLHTLKGLARTLGFTALASAVHEAETLVEESRLKGVERLVRKISNLRATIDKIKSIAQNKLQIKLDQNMIVLNFTEQQIIEAYRDKKLDTIVLAQACYDLKSSITFFETTLRKQAKERGKEPPILIVNSPEIYMLKDNAKTLDGIFGHILRNAVDHGIETAQERAAQFPAKSPSGTIAVNVTRKSRTICIRVTDDGRGLALKKIRQKALTLGLISEHDELDPLSLANLIFTPSFSTQEEVSESSGRGVGMDAVKTSVKSLGGKVEIEIYDDHAAFVPWALIIELDDSIMVNTNESFSGQKMKTA